MTTKEFIEKLAKDEELCKKLTATKTAEEGYAVAKEAGVTDDLETFVAAVAKNELSDADLGAVAGGAVDQLQGWDWDGIICKLSRLSRMRAI